MSKRIVCTIIVFALTLICIIALCTPQVFEEYALTDSSDSTVQSLESGDISFYSDCTVDENGVIDVNEEGFPCIEFALDAEEFRSLELNFAENTDGMTLYLYYDMGDGYDEQNFDTVYMRGLDTDYVIPVDCETKSLRIDLTEDCDFDSLELHSSYPAYEKVEPAVKPSAWILGFVAAAVLALAVFLTDSKFKYIEKYLVFKKEYLYTFLKLVAGAAASLAVGFAAEKIYTAYISASEFNIFRYVLFTGTAFIIAVLVIFFKDLKEKPEKAFVCIMLTLSVLYIVLTPFGHACWDAESHYRFTLNTSYIGENSYYSLADEKIMKISDDYWPSQDVSENEQHIEIMNDSYSKLLGYTEGVFSPAHTPAALAMALARFVRLSFYNVTNISKLANALLCCVACYLALRKLKSGKMIAAVIALFPTGLFLAANLSYDPWVTSLGMLGMAYFVGIQQQKEGYVKTSEVLIMCIAFGLSIVPKLIYAPLLVLPLLMNPKKIDSKKKYYLTCLATIAVFGALLMLRSLMIIKSGGDARGGSEISTVGQIKFILGNPLGYAKILLNFLRSYLSYDSMKMYITNFAYLGIGEGSVVFVVLMVLTALTDKNEHDKKAYTLLSKLAVIALYFGLSVLIATSMYVAFTPVGSQEINGCQPRYLIPLLYPLLAIVGYNGLNNKLNRTFYNGIILVACVAVNIYCIWTKLMPGWV